MKLFVFSTQHSVNLLVPPIFKMPTKIDSDVLLVLPYSFPMSALGGGGDSAGAGGGIIWIQSAA